MNSFNSHAHGFITRVPGNPVKGQRSMATFLSLATRGKFVNLHSAMATSVSLAQKEFKTVVNI